MHFFPNWNRSERLTNITAAVLTLMHRIHNKRIDCVGPTEAICPVEKVTAFENAFNVCVCVDVVAKFATIIEAK